MTTRKSGTLSAIATPKTPDLREYTLQRDGDRGLKFVGSEVAAIDSGDRQITRRAAIYRTRGGKYVAEFSSRPASTVSPYRDPPSMPSRSQVVGQKDAIIEQISMAAEWRDGVFEQYPNDLRNKHSADALRSLARALEEIYADNSRWVCIWIAKNAIDESAVDDIDEIGGAQGRVESELIREFGFHQFIGKVSPLKAATFLDELLQALQEAAQPEPATPPSGKAQAFESLDEAIGWFRPGRLTTELLRLLGRDEPEFIE